SKSRILCLLAFGPIARLGSTSQAPMMPQPKTSGLFRFIVAGALLALCAGCATTSRTAGRLQYGPAASIMREARSSQVPVEKRAADYLQAAAMTAPLLGTGAQETP